MIFKQHFILYVKDRARSTQFYKNVLGIEPSLDVPGMTEFELPGGSIIGLMPEAGIKKLLNGKTEDPSAANGIPRCEIYLLVDDPQYYYDSALQNGALEISPLSLRDWGHRAAYCADPDGHILAFAIGGDFK